MAARVCGAAVGPYESIFTERPPAPTAAAASPAAPLRARAAAGAAAAPAATRGDAFFSIANGVADVFAGITKGMRALTIAPREAVTPATRKESAALVPVREVAPSVDRTATIFTPLYRGYISDLFLREQLSYVAIGVKPMGFGTMKTQWWITYHPSVSPKSTYNYYISPGCIVRDFYSAENERKVVAVHREALNELFAAFPDEISDRIGKEVTADGLFEGIKKVVGLFDEIPGFNKTLADMLQNDELMGILLGYGPKNSAAVEYMKRGVAAGKKKEDLEREMNLTVSCTLEEVQKMKRKYPVFIAPVYYMQINDGYSYALKNKYRAAQEYLHTRYNAPEAQVELVALALLTTGGSHKTMSLRELERYDGCKVQMGYSTTTGARVPFVMPVASRAPRNVTGWLSLDRRGVLERHLASRITCKHSLIYDSASKRYKVKVYKSNGVFEITWLTRERIREMIEEGERSDPLPSSVAQSRLLAPAR